MCMIDRNCPENQNGSHVYHHTTSDPELRAEGTRTGHKPSGLLNLSWVSFNVLPTQFACKPRIHSPPITHVTEEFQSSFRGGGWVFPHMRWGNCRRGMRNHDKGQRHWNIKISISFKHNTLRRLKTKQMQVWLSEGECGIIFLQKEETSWPWSLLLLSVTWLVFIAASLPSASVPLIHLCHTLVRGTQTMNLKALLIKVTFTTVRITPHVWYHLKDRFALQAFVPDHSE